ncbi:nuclear transport factor 2 family protein [Alteromonas gilva]|uniref:Nuclear transport factor 2 family protein n=1 Tax=Alteromonas gilva TaxID=2987522 RepID=A0ABT5KX75_9ALTE|nr:nuclear transport factor 2 family protein [Alteromonas gilva]MDC8829365.1 nuclear transport factor 2 family protein [Alteromonas gilva]
MKITHIASTAILATTVTVFGANAGTASEHESLYNTVAALDTAVFNAFNHCSEPGQLDKHASYFAADVEFYHDNGGVTWTREEMIAGTRKNVCGKFRRELVEGSLEVYPIKGFGAIAQGSHRFCQFSSGVCDGLADFTMVWSEQNGKWELTRVLSYGHRPASNP